MLEQIQENGTVAMRDLKDELASLRIERDAPRRTRWGLIIFSLLVVGVVGAGAYLYFVAGVRPVFGAVEVEPVQAVVQTNTGPNAGTPILTASGYLVAQREAVVSAKIQGRISQLNVDAGSFVHAGDVIARLDDTDYAASIIKAKADIQYAEANLAEMKRQAKLQQDLYASKVVSQDALDAANAKVQLADATLQQDKANLALQQSLFDFTVIRAPFTGMVLKKMTEVGDSVAPIPPGVNISTSSGAIVTMADMNSIEAEVDINEANVGQVHTGDPAEVSVQAFPDHKYKGYLRQLIPTADRTKGTVTGKVAITNKDSNLRPEMSCNATFLQPPKQSAKSEKSDAAPVRIITVPKDAITTRDGKSVVFSIENNKVHLQPVVTGNDLHGQVIVKQGLAGAETLVNNPPQKLQDGDAVKVKS